MKKNFIGLFLFLNIFFCTEKLGWEEMPFYCNEDKDCAEGWKCDKEKHKCFIIVVEPDINVDLEVELMDETLSEEDLWGKENHKNSL